MYKYDSHIVMTGLHTDIADVCNIVPINCLKVL